MYGMAGGRPGEALSEWGTSGVIVDLKVGSVLHLDAFHFAGPVRDPALASSDQTLARSTTRTPVSSAVAAAN